MRNFEEKNCLMRKNSCSLIGIFRIDINGPFKRILNTVMFEQEYEKTKLPTKMQSTRENFTVNFNTIPERIGFNLFKLNTNDQN